MLNSHLWHGILIRTIKQNELFVLIIAVVFFATAFLSFENLIETQLLSKSYVFIAGAIICSVSALFFLKKIEIRFDALAIIIALFVGYVMLRMGLAGQFGLKFLLAAAFLLFYFFFKSIGSKHNDSITTIIVLVCVSQAVYGLLQYAGIIYSPGRFPMMGSFDNPAGIASLLAAGLPFCFTLAYKSGVWKYAGWASFVIITAAIVLSGSRAGMVAAALVTWLFFADKYKAFFKRYKLIFPILIVSVCILGVGLFYLKKDSAVGRLLIWKTSLEMIKDRPISGHGAGAFMANYMDYQAEYFKNNPDSIYSQLADDVTHPFNEYILLTTEYGFAGLFILLSLAALIILKAKRLSPYTLCLLSIAVLSCFSYPSRYSVILLLLAYSLANIELYGKLIRLNVFGRIACIAILSVLSYKLIIDIKFESKWGNIAKLRSWTKQNELLGDYDRLYENWNGNPLFLYNYGAVLRKTGDYEKSVAIFAECEMYFNDYDIQMSLANNYLDMKDYSSAETIYIYASYMCPNRFMPLYKLTELYDATNQEDKSLELARQIIDKEVKIASVAISQIKAKMYTKISEDQTVRLSHD